MSESRLTDELFAPHFAVKKTRKVVTNGIDDVWAIDLADMRHTSVPEWLKANDGYEYIFVCIDCFSRYAWAVPMKKKDAKTSWGCLEKIMTESGRIPAKIWADEGSEFKDVFAKRLKEKGIVQYSTYGKHKASIAERFNRTFKHMLYPELAKMNSMKWIDILPAVIKGYNNSRHSALDMSPVKASLQDNEEALWKHQYGNIDHSPHKPPKFKLGDMVRIFKSKKGVFERGFDPNWSREFYVICGIGLDYPYTYRLRELPNDTDSGLEMKGVWYENDLQKTAWKYGDPLDVDKVIKERKVGRRVEVLVRWLGWSPKFDTWVPKADLEDV